MRSYCYSGYYNFPINDFVKPKPITRTTCNSCRLDMSEFHFCRNKLFQNSYFNRIPKLWNNLPSCTRSSTSVSNFKSALFKHYLDPVHTTPFSNENNTVLFQIRLPSTLQRSENDTKTIRLDPVHTTRFQNNSRPH